MRIRWTSRESTRHSTGWPRPSWLPCQAFRWSEQKTRPASDSLFPERLADGECETFEYQFCDRLDGLLQPQRMPPKRYRDFRIEEYRAEPCREQLKTFQQSRLRASKKQPEACKYRSSHAKWRIYGKLARASEYSLRLKLKYNWILWLEILVFWLCQRADLMRGIQSRLLCELKVNADKTELDLSEGRSGKHNLRRSQGLTESCQKQLIFRQFSR